MKSRVLRIKKSTWLTLSLVVNTLFFVATSVLFCLFLNNYNLWFFAFCLFVGLHLINKSLLFKFDSSCYFGVLLFLIGIFYFIAFNFEIVFNYPFLVLIAFSFASFCTFLFFNQSFQLFLFISLFFVSIGLELFLFNLISIWIFVAFIGVSVILLLVRYFTLNRSK